MVEEVLSLFSIDEEGFAVRGFAYRVGGNDSYRKQSFIKGGEFSSGGGLLAVY